MIEDTLNRIATALERIAAVAEGQQNLPLRGYTTGEVFPDPKCRQPVAPEPERVGTDNEAPAEPAKRSRAKKAEPARERTDAEKVIDAKLDAAKTAPAEATCAQEALDAKAPSEAPPAPKVTDEELRAQCRAIARENLKDAAWSAAFTKLLADHEYKGISAIPDGETAAFLAELKTL